MRTICISLLDDLKARQRVAQHLGERGIPFEFLPAINGRKSGLFTTHFQEKVGAHDDGEIIPPKHVGLNLSHYMAWTVCSFLPDSHVLIVEDDVQFEVGWAKRFNQAVRDTPADFDMLFVGSCCCKEGPKRLIKGEVYEAKWPSCTHCYLLAKKACPVLLETQQNVYGHIDHQLMQQSFPKMKIFTVLPRIATQYNQPTLGE